MNKKIIALSALFLLSSAVSQASNIIRVTAPVSFHSLPSETPEEGVESVLSLAAASMPNARVGKNYAFNFSEWMTSSSGLPVTWAMSSPIPGLSLSSSGVLSGTPSFASASSMTITIKSGSKEAVQNFSLTTVDPLSLELDEATLVDAMLGAPYSHDFATYANWKNLDGETAPTLSWNNVNTLPAGLTLSPNGLLDGTPTELGSRSFEVKATSGDYTANKIYTITVADAVLKAKSITAGGNHTCAITVDNSAVCWGNNAMGQLGNGTQTSNNKPQPVIGLTGNVLFLGAGLSHTCAILTGGAAKCWGDGGSGRLGNNAAIMSKVPVAVAGNHIFSTLSVGNDNTCGITSTGSAMCWGNSTLGKLGDGSGQNQVAPAQVFGLSSGVVKIATSYYGSSCAVINDGRTVCWGAGETGQLGNGATLSFNTPVQVSMPAGVVFSSISGGMRGFCAVGTDTKGYCWGSGGYGEIGNGFAASVNIPTEVINYTFKSISAGRYRHTCGVTTTNKAVCWGNNQTFQTGLAAGTATPQPLTSLGDVSMISSGYWHSCALEVNGTGKCWGSTTDGRLGSATATGNVMTPVSVQMP